MDGQRRRQMPEKEQRKEREREEKTEHRIRTLLDERWRAPGGRAPFAATVFIWCVNQWERRRVVGRGRNCSSQEKGDVPF